MILVMIAIIRGICIINYGCLRISIEARDLGTTGPVISVPALQSDGLGRMLLCLPSHTAHNNHMKVALGKYTQEGEEGGRLEVYSRPTINRVSVSSSA